MKRLPFILAVLCPLLSAAAERPNILFIAVDDMRYDLGCYWVKHLLTPNLDRLAASGVMFNFKSKKASDRGGLFVYESSTRRPGYPGELE